MLASSLLSAVPGLRHAFFTRDGGVSDGIYAGLNGGLGSNDDPAHVAENRRRAAQSQLFVSQARVSEAHAAARAASASSRTRKLRCGRSRSARRSAASTTSTGESSLRE